MHAAPIKSYSSLSVVIELKCHQFVFFAFLIVLNGLLTSFSVPREQRDVTVIQRYLFPAIRPNDSWNSKYVTLMFTLCPLPAKKTTTARVSGQGTIWKRWHDAHWSSSSGLETCWRLFQGNLVYARRGYNPVSIFPFAWVVLWLVEVSEL